MDNLKAVSQKIEGNDISQYVYLLLVSPPLVGHIASAVICHIVLF